MLPRVNVVLASLLEEFKNGTIPNAVHYAMFPIPDIPSARWSLLNRLMMFYHGTEDARGYKQWKGVKRHVMKGKQSFDILVPVFKKVEDEQTKETSTVLSGFCCGCVFRVEDTEGEPLDYQKLELPEFPLQKRAEELGVSIHAIGGNTSHFGYYDPKKSLIALATPEEKTFFHELCHVADHKLKGEIKTKQDPLQEITAELAAQALCRIVGKDGDKYFGNSYRYIENYANELEITPYNAVIRVISDVEAILKYLLVETELQAV
jgi:antirestriction protein ArdC